MFINSINNFRALAIIFIVAGHCLFFFDNILIIRTNSIVVNSFANLILGGSTLFVFISGFLFHHVYYKKFDFLKYMLKKIKFVLVPFILLTTIPIIFLILKCVFLSTNDSFEQKLSCVYNIPFLKYYLTGTHFFIGYWYIPFIMIIFSLSPFYIQFIKLKLKTQILITLILFISSILIHRGSEDQNFFLFQNAFFYLSIYLIGILSSEKKEVIHSAFKGKEFYLLSLVFILALIQANSGKLGTYNKEPFTFGGIDLMTIQKTILSFFFIIWLNRFENYKSKILNIIATNSFGIYFTHGIVIWVFEMIKIKLGLSFSINQYLLYCLYFITIFSLSLSLTLMVKKMSPKYSRFIIGS